MPRNLRVRLGIISVVLVSAVSVLVAQQGPPFAIKPASAVNGGGGISSPQLLAPDGTSALPAYSFASEPTLGLWRSSASVVTLQGLLVVTSNIQPAGALAFTSTGNANEVRMASGVTYGNTLTGMATIENPTRTMGVQLKVDSLPTVSSCGGGSPAVVAGSTPLSGSVTVGTGSPATCTITYGGTAYPSAPHCSGAVETVTAGSARAMGYSSTTTVLTIVPATAWADGSVVNWTCFSAK